MLKFRGERTKYWSISASLIGALLGVIGTTLASEIRMRKIREMIPSASQLSPLLNQMASLVNKQSSEVLNVFFLIYLFIFYLVLFSIWKTWLNS